jgi:hypothetical protein
MPDHYELGYHSSEVTCPHIALRNDELGTRDEFVDLRLYHVSTSTDGENWAVEDESFIQSKAAVELLLARANGLIDAIGRVQNVQRGYELSKARLMLGLDDDVSDDEVEARMSALSGEDYDAVWDDLDRSTEDQIEVATGASEALGNVLDILQILAHGGTPAQGEPVDA